MDTGCIVVGYPATENHIIREIRHFTAVIGVGQKKVTQSGRYDRSHKVHARPLGALGVRDRRAAPPTALLSKSRLRGSNISEVFLPAFRPFVVLVGMKRAATCLCMPAHRDHSVSLSCAWDAAIGSANECARSTAVVSAVGAYVGRRLLLRMAWRYGGLEGLHVKTYQAAPATDTIVLQLGTTITETSTAVEERCEETATTTRDAREK